jgi:hypothetical protein
VPFFDPDAPTPIIASTVDQQRPLPPVPLSSSSSSSSMSTSMSMSMSMLSMPSSSSSMPTTTTPPDRYPDNVNGDSDRIAATSRSAQLFAALVRPQERILDLQSLVVRGAWVVRSLQAAGVLEALRAYIEDGSGSGSNSSSSSSSTSTSSKSSGSSSDAIVRGVSAATMAAGAAVVAAATGAVGSLSRAAPGLVARLLDLAQNLTVPAKSPMSRTLATLQVGCVVLRCVVLCCFVLCCAVL